MGRVKRKSIGEMQKKLKMEAKETEKVEERKREQWGCARERNTAAAANPGAAKSRVSCVRGNTSTIYR